MISWLAFFSDMQPMYSRIVMTHWTLGQHILTHYKLDTQSSQDRTPHNDNWLESPEEKTKQSG